MTDKQVVATSDEEAREQILEIAYRWMPHGSDPTPAIDPPPASEVFTTRGTMSREMAGRTLLLRAIIAYPGSMVSDLRIGSSVVPLSNKTIRAALSALLPQEQK